MEILNQITLSRKYKYKLITEPDGIRLIELHPLLDPSTVIRCSLVYTSISLYDNQDIYCHYTAISYVWGNPEKIKAILVDGRSLKITANLFSALKDLRHQTMPLLLWVDGICINQKDNEEKGMQIRLMGQIMLVRCILSCILGPQTPRVMRSDAYPLYGKALMWIWRGSQLLFLAKSGSREYGCSRS
jgi:hypothetical protein